GTANRPSSELLPFGSKPSIYLQACFSVGQVKSDVRAAPAEEPGVVLAPGVHSRLCAEKNEDFRAATVRERCPLSAPSRSRLGKTRLVQKRECTLAPGCALLRAENELPSQRPTLTSRAAHCLTKMRVTA